MDRLGIWWAVAGGWAIDLWLDRVTREHHDVEVAIRRDDQRTAHDGLTARWELSCLDPPGSTWRRWPREHSIAAPAFQVQAAGDGVTFDLFLESVVDDEWVFRRDGRIRRPLRDVTTVTESGLPVVVPEVQLLYMAKSDDAKNQLDFTNACTHLDQASATWLAHALAVAHPSHPWREHLPDGSGVEA